MRSGGLYSSQYLLSPFLPPSYHINSFIVPIIMLLCYYSSFLSTMYSLRLPDRVLPVAVGEGYDPSTATAVSTQSTATSTSAEECPTGGYDETAVGSAPLPVHAVSINEDCTYSSTDSLSLSPTLLLKLFQAHKPQFSGADQQDAQEFLTELLDTLHEDLKQPDPAKEGMRMRMGKSSMDLPSSSATTTTTAGRYAKS